MVPPKICLITGASSGIGKVTALEIARTGATVVMVCRNPLKGEEVRREIVSASGNPGVELLTADLASQKQVRQLAAEFMQRYSRLDILVNNAGLLATSQRTLTEDGLETTFATNHLGHFLLTNLLRAPLLAAPAARIINVSSDLHRRAKLDFDNLQCEKSYRQWNAYNVSKLANVLFTIELASRLKGTGITTNCLHPGVVASNFASGSSPLINFFLPLAHLFMIDAQKGAETSLYLALSDRVAGVSGKYFKKKQETAPAATYLDEATRKKMWEVSAELVKLKEGF